VLVGRVNDGSEGRVARSHAGLAVSFSSRGIPNNENPVLSRATRRPGRTAAPATTPPGRGVVPAPGSGGHAAHAVLLATGGSYQPPGDRVRRQAEWSAGDEAVRRAPKAI
jgi:hypothetical protein